MEKNLHLLIDKHSSDIYGLIHIGAHSAWEYANDVKNKRKNFIFFEPLINNFNMLFNNMKSLDNVVIYNLALGNTEGEIEMFVSTNDGMSSSILEAEEHLRIFPQILFNRREIVKINKLDNIEYDRNKYNFMVIDVQGYELEVLSGASNSLKHIDYMMIEINYVHLYKNGALVNELDLFLSDFGFNRIGTNCCETHGDAFYIKNKINID